jgi:hypothetical protein
VVENCRASPRFVRYDIVTFFGDQTAPINNHTGCRTVSLWWTQDPGHRDVVPVEVYDCITLADTVYVNQQTGGGQWQKLGTYFFDHGAVVVVVSDSSTHTTSVDAIQTTAADDCHTFSRVLIPGWNLLTPVHQTAVPMTLPCVPQIWTATGPRSLGSRNGTALDGSPIRRTRLSAVLTSHPARGISCFHPRPKRPIL